MKKERDGEIREKWDKEIWRVLGSKKICTVSHWQKRKENFLIYREIQKGAVAKSYVYN
jgi:hypothetical protein